MIDYLIETFELLDWTQPFAYVTLLSFILLAGAGLTAVGFLLWTIYDSIAWRELFCKVFGHWLKPIYMDDRLDGPAFIVCRVCHN